MQPQIVVYYRGEDLANVRHRFVSDAAVADRWLAEPEQADVAVLERKTIRL